MTDFAQLIEGIGAEAYAEAPAAVAQLRAFEVQFTLAADLVASAATARPDKYGGHLTEMVAYVATLLPSARSAIDNRDPLWSVR